MIFFFKKLNYMKLKLNVIKDYVKMTYREEIKYMKNI